MSMAETNVLPLDEYEIVGATLSADENELPVRLRPVLRTRSEPRAYALLYESAGAERLVPEDQEAVEELFAENQFYAFAMPLRAQPGYWLVQLRAGSAPEYLPRAAAQQRMGEEGERALVHSERAFIEGDLALARKRAAYAARALEDDPLPRLVLIALWRDDADESQLAYLSRPLRRFANGHIRQRFREVSHRRVIPKLIERIRADRLNADYDLVPPWLPASPFRTLAVRRRLLASLFGSDEVRATA
jgi:hypothetical protein